MSITWFRAFCIFCIVVLVYAITAYWIGISSSAAPGHSAGSDQIAASDAVVATEQGLLKPVTLQKAQAFSWQDFRNGRVPIYQQGVSSGSTSVFPLAPLETYQSYIQDAEQGDARSQMMVARSLHECHTYSGQDAIDTAASQGLLNEQAEIAAVALSERCASLVAYLGEDQVTNFRTFYDWINKAEASGSIDAKLWKLANNPDYYGADTLKNELQGVDLSGDVGTAFVVEAVAAYSSLNSDDDVLYGALLLLKCESQAACMVENQTGYLEHHLKTNEYSNVLALKEKLTPLLAEKNLPAILDLMDSAQ